MAKIRQVGERVFFRRLKESGVEINPAQGRIMFALWQKDGALGPLHARPVIFRKL